jgi:hypothetical protein
MLKHAIDRSAWMQLRDFKKLRGIRSEKEERSSVELSYISGRQKN